MYIRGPGEAEGVGTGVGARGAEEVTTGTVLPSASAISVCFARFAAGPSPASTLPGAVPAAVVAAVGSPDETTAAVMLPSCLPLVDGVSNLIPGSAASGVPCSSSSSKKMFTGHDKDDTIKLVQIHGV
ncbi:MAG: hypothetical protein FRX49_05946 [Trebouxia sp. A1-2]|nr:MAG: hypothetical protein FRX49_05946 [Trebouxia sp. A1-2]